MKEFKDVIFDIVRQGVPTVNHCLLLIESKDIVALDIDLEQKHCTIAYTGAEDDTPLVGLLGYGDKDYNPTEIIFPEYKGWSIWSISISRYTVAICLINLDFLEETTKPNLDKEALINKEVCVYNKNIITHGKLGTVIEYLKKENKYKVRFDDTWIGYYKRKELRTLEQE